MKLSYYNEYKSYLYNFWLLFVSSFIENNIIAHLIYYEYLYSQTSVIRRPRLSAVFEAKIQYAKYRG